MVNNAAETKYELKGRPALGRSNLRIDWFLACCIVISSLLLLQVSRPLLTWWYWEWIKPESYYQHAPLIPFIVGLMIWHRRVALSQTDRKPQPWALAVVVPALALLVLAIKLEMQAVQSFAFLLVITSCTWLLLGNQWVRGAAFPIAFLWLMAPLPGPVLNDATIRTQMLSTTTANKLLNLLTFHTNRQGNVIQMEDFKLFVDAPCSGFHLLLSLTTLSAAFAYLFDGSARRRIGLFLFSIPLSIVVNSIRIALIGIVGECMGSSAAAVFHDWSGLMTVALGVMVLFAVAKGIGCRSFAGWQLF